MRYIKVCRKSDNNRESKKEYKLRINVKNYAKKGAKRLRVTNITIAKLEERQLLLSHS